MDAVQKADSGHPGMPMGMADIAVTLWSRHLEVDPSQPDWPDRDRFVLSNGHGSMLLYSLLHLCGFPLELEDLKQFRQWGSHTAGHPEIDHAIGIEMTFGSSRPMLRQIAIAKPSRKITSSSNRLVIVSASTRVSGSGAGQA